MIKQDLNRNRNWVGKKWGTEDWLDNNEDYCGKILHLNEGCVLGLHYHKIKKETFYLLDGKVTIYAYDDPDIDLKMTSWHEFYDNLHLVETIEFEKESSFYIPRGRRHAVYADNSSRIIECSTQHFDEDSYRILPSYKTW